MFKNHQQTLQDKRLSNLLFKDRYDQPFLSSLVLVKCREHISIYTVHGEPIFFQHFDGPIYPTLRLLHKYPYILPMVRVDRGAIRFLLAGAHMMCPGFTSKGGYLPPAEEGLAAGVPVAIHAEGKEHAVGVLKEDSKLVRLFN
ncbi:translation machinery-associated protein 20 [Lentinula edodes]|uniref:Translation machinery-associated protein 20 n=1 Tax=Lentinula edodes TaxID=5353 RepID=A0A1Q3E542_LENED|nr:translation machinery-associated protein 20 [Lentinula edodes]